MERITGYCIYTLTLDGVRIDLHDFYPSSGVVAVLEDYLRLNGDRVGALEAAIEIAWYILPEARDELAEMQAILFPLMDEHPTGLRFSRLDTPEAVR